MGPGIPENDKHSVILFNDDWHHEVTSSFEHYVAPSATSQSIHYQGEELFGQALGINAFFTNKSDIWDLLYVQITPLELFEKVS